MQAKNNNPSIQESELRAHLRYKRPLYIIHYGCGNFKAGPAPITCVVVVDYYDGNVHSFLREHSEQAMLEELLKFFVVNKGAKYVHWNMRNPEYGFRQFADRLNSERAHREVPGKMDVFCLNDILKARYGPSYIRHPRLAFLAIYNGLADPGSWIPGIFEASLEAVGGAEPIILESTQKKAAVIRDLTRRFVYGDVRIPKQDKDFLPPEAATALSNLSIWERIVTSWSEISAQGKWALILTVIMALFGAIWKIFGVVSS